MIAAIVFAVAIFLAGPHLQASSRVMGVVRAPQLVKPVDPICPKTDDGASVESRLEITVDKDGHVTNVELVDGPSNAYTKAASDALYKWEFRPGTLNGQPVVVLLRFRIQGCCVKGPFLQW